MDETLNKKDSTITREKRWSGFLFLVIFIVLTLGIGASGYHYYKSQAKQLREGINDQLNAVADLKVKQIVAWRDDRIEDATIILKQSFFVPFVHLWLENPADFNLKEKVSVWMNIFQENKNYKAVFLADAQGNTRLSLPQRDKQLSACLQPHCAEALRTRKIVFTDLHFVATTHRIHLAFIIPLFDSDTAPFGFVVLEIDPYKFLYPFIQTWPTPSKTAETLLVRREGNEVVFLNELRHRKNTALTLKESLSRKNMPALVAVKGKTGIVEGVDYRGVPVIAALRKIPGSPWFLIAKVDSDEASAALKKQSLFVAFIVTLLILLSGAGFGLLWRHQRSQFYKKQYETEHKLATERKQAENALRESEKRLYNVLEALPTMICLLTPDYHVAFANRSFREKFGESHGRYCYDYCFGRTGPCEFCETYNVLKTGKPHRWEVTSPDGSCIIDAYDFPFTDVDGSSLILEMDIDITERKRAEEILRENEQKYHALIETTHTGYVIIDFAGKVLDANDEYARLTGYERRDEILGRSLLEWTAAYDKERNAQAVEKCFRQGFIRNLELDYVGPQGQTIPIEGNGTLVTTKSGPQILALCRNIAERKKTEKESEKLIGEQRALLEKVKMLSGLLPICASCKKIRDDKGYWNQIDAYIRDHSEAEFTHSICPECMKKLYPDFEIVE